MIFEDKALPAELKGQAQAKNHKKISDSILTYYYDHIM